MLPLFTNANVINFSNSSQCPDFEDNECLQLLLQTSHVLSSSNELAALCIIEIGKSVFDGTHNLLNAIIKYVNLLKDKDKLQQIFDIIKNITLNHDEIDDVIDNNSLSMFHKLSIESISNICSYLDKTDISSFKLVSHDIGIVCLQRMVKYSFGIFNINKSIELSSLYPNILTINDVKLINYNLYHATNTMYDLSKHWQNIYHIPTSYQLLYNHQSSKFIVISHQIINKQEADKKLTVSLQPLFPTKKNESIIEYIGSKQIKEQCFGKQEYILFDTRNIIIISNKNDKAKRMNDINQNIVNEININLLQYFDIFTQKLYCLQTIATDKHTKVQMIIDYVKCQFVTTFAQQKELYDKMQNDMQLNDLELVIYKRNNALNIWHHDHEVVKLEYDDPCCYDNAILTLQLTYDDKISHLKQEYESKDEIFCENISVFIDKLLNKETITIKYVHDISMLKAKMKALCNNDNVNVDALCNGIFNTNIEIFKGATYGNIRKKISEKINGIISHQNIELFEESSKYKYLYILSWDGIFNKQLGGNLFFDLVSDKINKTKHKTFYNDEQIKTYNNTFESLPGLSPKQIAILTKHHNTANTVTPISVINKSGSKILMISQLFLRKRSNTKDSNIKQSNLNENNKKKKEEKEDKNDDDQIETNPDESSIKNMAMVNEEEIVETNYFIKIYGPNELFIPILHSDNINVKVSFIMKYNYKLKLDDIFIKDIIKEICKPIYGDCFQDILYLLQQNQNDICYALHIRNKTYFENEIFNATKHPLRVNRVYLILYRSSDSKQKSILLQR